MINDRWYTTFNDNNIDIGGQKWNRKSKPKKNPPFLSSSKTVEIPPFLSRSKLVEKPESRAENKNQRIKWELWTFLWIEIKIKEWNENWT